MGRGEGVRNQVQEKVKEEVECNNVSFKNETLLRWSVQLQSRFKEAWISVTLAKLVTKCETPVYMMPIYP